MAESLHDQRYRRIVNALVEARHKTGLTQRDLAARLNRPPSYVGKVESLQRRLDVIEVADWLTALGAKPGPFLARLLGEMGRKG